MKKDGRVMRIKLDDAAAQAVNAMIDSLNHADVPVSLEATKLLNFLITDYFGKHFLQDRAFFIAEFFDIETYYETEHKNARVKSNYEQLVREALERARQVRSCKRRKRKDESSNTELR